MSHHMEIRHLISREKELWLYISRSISDKKEMVLRKLPLLPRPEKSVNCILKSGFFLNTIKNYVIVKDKV